MSGIAGWISYPNKIKEKNTIYKEMLATLKHRGPDDEGVYVEDHAVLLHTRLKVMDPENSAQPMHYQHYVLIYNGELCNTNEMREYLIEKGYSFKTKCDSEVVLKAYACDQEQCLQKLNGVYAFSIWDKEKKTLFIARDRLGIKPLFFHLNEEHFLFASEIKTLLANPMVESVIEEEGLKELFLLGPARTSGTTPFTHIKELKQGEYALYDREGLHIHTYWRLKAKQHKENLEQTKEHVKQLVTTCVNDQLDSDVGICSFLSGGLDSSIIASIASQRYQPLETFSIEYEENEKYFKKSIFQPTRDVEFIDIMVDDVGAKHTNYIINQKDLVAALEDATYARDLPGMADVDSSLLLFAKKTKETKSVALSGEGADEIFAGYPWYYNEEILWRDEFPWSHSYDIRVSCLKEGLIEDGENYVKEAYYKSINDVSFLESDDAKEKRMREMFYLNMRWFLQTLLDRKDRMTMYAGVEARVPFLDYRLVEYAYNIPWRYKSLNGREKGILREAFRDLLPEVIVNRKKSPYPKTFHPDYTAMLIDKLNQILESDCLLTKVLDAQKVKDLMKHLDMIEVPWFGQLMKGPQILAYFIQMHYFFEKYHVVLKIKGKAV